MEVEGEKGMVAGDKVCEEGMVEGNKVCEKGMVAVDKVCEMGMVVGGKVWEKVLIGEGLEEVLYKVVEAENEQEEVVEVINKDKHEARVSDEVLEVAMSHNHVKVVVWRMWAVTVNLVAAESRHHRVALE